MHRLANTSSHLTQCAPTTASSRTARQFVVAEVPKGPLEERHFALESAELPELGDGKVRVRVEALTIGAGQRASLQGSAGYAGASKGETNAVMDGTGFGVVEASSDDSIAIGDTVMGSTGWREAATVSGKRLTKLPAGIDAALALGALGTNGLTAYFGLLEIGQPQQGETVVISAAAGSVGHIVGQVRGPLMWCTRPVL